ILPGLPVSSLMIAAPVTAAAILVHRSRGTAGVAALLRRSFDHRRITSRRWYLPTILLLPLAMLVTYAMMRALGRPLPDSTTIRWRAVPVLLLVFFVGALAEELGWSGYALEPLQQRLGALGASLVLGIAWSVWHFIPLAQVGRSPSWIAWWSLYAVASRVLYGWIYNNTGRSVFAVTLFHAMANLSWQLFPNDGSHFDPQNAGLVVSAVALMVIAFWGPRTLTRRSAHSVTSSRS
ncbi:MAG: CPBP family intramembrane metalloprotease, partial [Acidimicrobiia bacterium]|nr:CPBP family intramembrane metalloprotease [Acidimicrobiia bacterium]